MRRRFMNLRKRITQLSRKNGREKTLNRAFNLNVMYDEFNTALDEIMIREGHEDDAEIDPEKENLRSQVGDLQQSLERMQEELSKTTDERDQERSNAADFCQRSKFLENHIHALETEMQEKLHENDTLKKSNADLQRQLQQENKPLGKKKFSELGPDAISKTRSSYREAFVNRVNHYGENRNLVVERLVLREKDSGEQLEINAERPRTFENLNEDEKRRLHLAGWWKDKERMSDKGQSALNHIGTMPAASHIKSYEQELNAKLGEIQMVGLLKD